MKVFQKKHKDNGRYIIIYILYIYMYGNVLNRAKSDFLLKSIILGRGFSSTMPAVPEMGPLQRCEKQ